tara:strand:+ start:519 stop:746 length:228 start_codon:yes stop_codon:yes gene_type:complete
LQKLLASTIKNIILIILVLPSVTYILELPFAFASLRARRLHGFDMIGKNIFMLPFYARTMVNKESNNWEESPPQA